MLDFYKSQRDLYIKNSRRAAYPSSYGNAIKVFEELIISEEKNKWLKKKKRM